MSYAAPPGAAPSAPLSGAYDRNAPWPSEVRLFRDEARLEVDFQDGRRYAFSAEYLRVESPSAEVQGHSAGEKKIVAGRRHVKIDSVEPVGNYAVRIVFDDKHDSGIYSWQYLSELGAKHDEKWKTYLAALLFRGLSRDP